MVASCGKCSGETHHGSELMLSKSPKQEKITHEFEGGQMLESVGEVCGVEVDT